APGGTAVSQHEWDAGHAGRRTLIEAASRDLDCDAAKIVAAPSEENAGEWNVDGCGRRGVYREKNEAIDNGRSGDSPVIIVTHDFVRRSPAAASSAQK